MKKVMIAGVVYNKNDNGTYSLVNDDVDVVIIPDNTIEMKIFEKHQDGFGISYVMGNWCINGCQEFHKDDADYIFDDHNVETEYRSDIINAFHDIKDNTMPCIDMYKTISPEAAIAYKRLLSLNGFGFYYSEDVARRYDIMTPDEIINTIIELETVNFDLRDSLIQRVLNKVQAKEWTVEQCQKIIDMFGDNTDVVPVYYTTKIAHPDQQLIASHIYNNASLFDLHDCTKLSDEVVKDVFLFIHSDIRYDVLISILLEAHRRGFDLTKYIERFKNHYKFNNNNIDNAVLMIIGHSEFSFTYLCLSDLMRILLFKPSPDNIKMLYDIAVEKKSVDCKDFIEFVFPQHL